jgi:hypothetical protein
VSTRPREGGAGASAGCTLTVLDAQGRVSLALQPRGDALHLCATSMLGESDELPEVSSSLVRLARWVRSRFSPELRASTETDRALGEALARAIGGEAIRFDRAGAGRVLEVELDALPSAEALEAWLAEFRAAER